MSGTIGSVFKSSRSGLILGTLPPTDSKARGICDFARKATLQSYSDYLQQIRKKKRFSSVACPWTLLLVGGLCGHCFVSQEHCSLECTSLEKRLAHIMSEHTGIGFQYRVMSTGANEKGRKRTVELSVGETFCQLYNDSEGYLRVIFMPNFIALQGTFIKVLILLQVTRCRYALWFLHATHNHPL